MTTTTPKSDEQRRQEAAEKFYQEELANATRCCETCRNILLNSEEQYKRGHKAGCAHEAEYAKFYLHSDDNYYWTPEAWREFQSLRAQLSSRDERIGRLREALKDFLAIDGRLCERIIMTEVERVVFDAGYKTIAEDDRIRGQG